MLRLFEYERLTEEDRLERLKVEARLVRLMELLVLLTGVERFRLTVPNEYPRVGEE